MGSRVLNTEFNLPPSFVNFSARPPLRAADPGQEGNQPRCYIPGKVLSWYGTQTVKCQGIELLVHLMFRNDEEDTGNIIWSGHQLVLGSRESGGQNTVVIQSPAAIPLFGPGWLWVDYQAISPESTTADNVMWEIQLVVFYK